MEYTDSQKAELKRQFATKRRNQFLAVVPIFVLVLIKALVGRGSHSSPPGTGLTIWAGLTIVIVVALVIFSFYNWRCPACKKYLGRSVSHRLCRNCGVELS